MKTLLRAALAASLAAAVSGCGGMITGGPLIRPGEPTGAIQVINQSGVVVDVVLISACSASTYGLNRLPDGAAIPSGGSYTFEVSAGCWDVDAGAFGIGEARQRLTVGPGAVTRYTVTG